MKGWAGTILRIDLSSRRISKEPLNMEWAQKFIGGRGLNSRTLYNEVGPEIDPMGPENRLIVGVGPCNGTLIAGSSRLTITAKSPLSGFLGDASTGATFGAEIKYAGYDQIIIQGKSDKPVYLWIEDEKVEIRDATHLWGKSTGQTITSLEIENKDPSIGVLVIGPAGENLVKFAAVIGRMGRAAARAGMGTVMGSKKLKAIVVRGTRGVEVADPEGLEETFREAKRLSTEENKEQYENISRFGLPLLVSTFNKLGILEIKGFQGGVFEPWNRLDAKYLLEHVYLKSKCCFGCFLPCDKIYIIKGGPYAGIHGAASETLPTHALGSRLGLSDLSFLYHLKVVLDEYGIDVMDWGGVVALAIECYENGILSTKDTGGLELKWGDKELMLKLLDMVVYRKGFGDLLAEGIRKASEVIGHGAEKYALHVKGLALDTVDPRGAKGTGLAYAVASRGAEHCRTIMPDYRPGIDPLTEEDKPAITKWCEECIGIEHCLETCMFCYGGTGCTYDFRIPELLAKIYTAVTGLDSTGEQLMEVGERLTNLERCFNIREGLQKKDDTLPDRFTKQAMPEGPSKGHVIGIGPMVDKYYELRGWDVETGLPRRAKLEALGLKEMADELESLGKLSKK